MVHLSGLRGDLNYNIILAIYAIFKNNFGVSAVEKLDLDDLSTTSFFTELKSPPIIIFQMFWCVKALDILVQL